MRYLYYILAIFIVVLALIVYQSFLDKPPAQKDAAIIVNERVISVDEFSKMKPAHDESWEDFINTIITKELLLQEAQREGLHKEESFRRSVQNFYEQSLIKALMDKQFRSLKATVSDEEVNRYYAFANKKLDITLYTADNAEDARAEKFREERKLIPFDELSTELKAAAIVLEKGQKGPTIQIGDKYVAIKLNDIGPIAGAAEPNKDEIRRLLGEEKRELMIKEWMEGLRKKASIKVLLKSSNGG